MPRVSKAKNARFENLKQARALNPKYGRILRPRKVPPLKEPILPEVDHEPEKVGFFDRNEHLQRAREIKKEKREKKKIQEKHRLTAVVAGNARRILHEHLGVSFIKAFFYFFY
jgi:hypothetical protein